MTIKILEPALAELSQAAAYYEDREKGLGAAFLNEYESCIERIEKFPRAWSPISKNCRRSLLKRFPYGIIFHIDGDIILIVAIMYLSREPAYWQDRL